MKKAIGFLFVVSCILAGCSESKTHYVVHFENGDIRDIGFCVIARQDVGWGNPTFVCDGQEYGNVSYVETVEK